MPNFFNNKHILIGMTYLLIFFVSIYLVAHQLTGLNYPSDTIAHLSFVNSYFDNRIYIPHPLWHYCVHMTTNLTLDDKTAAVLVTSLFILFWAYTVHAMLNFFIEGKYFIKLLLLLVLLVIGPLFIPYLSTNIYLGTGSPNIWHNVTLLTVKPFALLTVFFTISTLNNPDKLKYYLMTITIFIASMYAKPSFAIMFIPAIIIYVLLQKKYYDKRIFTFIITLVFTFLIISITQFLGTYSSENKILAFGRESSHIIIDFFGPWAHYTSSIFISIITAMFFPFIFMILNYHKLFNSKSLHTELLVFSWIMFIISILIFSIFAEEGIRYYHLNFGWSYNLALSILYVFSLISYFILYSETPTLKKSILNIILLIQISIGLYYLYNILQGGTYY